MGECRVKESLWKQGTKGKEGIRYVITGEFRNDREDHSKNGDGSNWSDEGPGNPQDGLSITGIDLAIDHTHQ